MQLLAFHAFLAFSRLPPSRGTPSGQKIKVGGVDAYVAEPAADTEHKDVAILYLPDVFGIWANSQLLADQFAANGYYTLIVDPFKGDAFDPDAERPKDFDINKWLAQGTSGDNPHTPEAVDPIVVDALRFLKQDKGFKKVGALGYCFGAKYVVRHYKSGIDVGYMAHPSFVEEAELAGIAGPLSIAAAEVDHIFPTEKRHKSEEILIKTGQPWQINLYSGVSHGFAVRGDMEDQKARFAKEQAFIQAVAWFNEHLK